MSDEYTLPVNDDVYITGETEEVVPDFSEIDDDDSTQETVTRTPANISSDNRSSIGSGELNPSPSDVVPADISTSDVIVTQRVRHQIDDYEPAALKTLSDAGAVFYAVYADGHEEGPVPWSEVHDLDPEGTIIELDEEIASAIAQNFWADTQGVHITDDPYDEWIEAYESNPQFPNLSTTKNYYNILLNAGGALLRRALNNLVSINRTAISFYDGLGNASSNIMAFFGRNGAQIGRSDEKHVVINSSGIGSYNGDGTVADFTMRGSSIVNSTISGSALVDNTITGGKIANATITGSNIDSGTITNANIANGTITNAKIANGTITGAKIDSGTITNANIADGTIQGSKIQGSTLTDIPFAAITDAEVEVASIADAQIATATITEAQVENLATNYAHLQNGVIDNATINHADVNGLNTTYATISNLNAATARIGDLEADHVSVDDFEAEQGYIDALQAATADIATIRADSAKVHSLTAAQLSAATAYIAALNADNITAASLSADVGKIHNLTANEISAAAAYIAALNADSVTAQNIIAMNGDFATVKANAAKVANLTAAQLEADHATVGSLDANYAQINMANVNNAWIANGTIKDGAISNGMINSVSANKLTAGTIDASNITVTNLNADNITTGTINGQRIGEGSLSLSKLEEDVYTETEVNNIVSNLQTQIDGAIETWTGTAVPTLSNSPASAWTTNAIKDTHVGDVYFVVNSQSQQNGYNYRFTKSGNTYSWQLIKDSDVTNALQRLTTAEGQITTFDSDISQLKTDTGTLTTKTTSLETRMSDAEADILDKVDTTTFNEVSDTVDSHSQSITQMTTTLSNKADSSTVSAVTQRVSKNEQDISGINTTIGTLTTTVESKADGSTVETMSTKLNTVETTVNGHTQSISSINSTLANKADSSTVSTLTTKVNNVSDTVDGHTSQLSSITQTQTSIQQNAVKSTVQLWFTKANTTAPNKPTAHVTMNNAATGNAWNLAVPTYNSAYPNYYYCYEYQYVDGSYGWSAVTRDIATGEMQERARTAITNAATADAKADNAATAAANAQADIDGLEIGGRNLLADTSNEAITYTGHGGYFDLPLTDWAKANIKTDDILTLSFDAYSSTSHWIDFYWRSASTSYISAPYFYPAFQINTSTSHYTVSSESGFDIGDSGILYLRLRNNSSGHSGSVAELDITISNLKLEKGTKATDWTPAPEDVDADISTAQTSADNAQATADKNVKESQQLWFTKANGSAPNKPTSKVTSTSTSGNAWITKVPTYSSSYPYYFYCMQYIAADGTVTWSDVVYDQATTEAQSVARTTSANLSTLQSDYATFKQTTQNFESTIGTTYATKTELSSAKRVGRNLLRWTAHPRYAGDNKSKNVDSTGWYRWSSNVTVTETNFGIRLDFTGNSTGIIIPFINDDVISGETTYTLSFDYRGTCAVDRTIVYALARSGSNWTTTTNTPLVVSETDWQHFEATFAWPTFGDRKAVSLLVPYNNTSGKWLEIRYNSMQLEHGSVATIWSPAVEDENRSMRFTLLRSNWNETSWAPYSVVGHTANWQPTSPTSSSSTYAIADCRTLNVGDTFCVTGVSTDKSITHSIICEVTSIPTAEHGSISAKTIAVNDNSTYAKAVESRVSTAETSIQQNTNSIALKANSSDVYTKTQTDGLISTEVSNRNSAIEQSANAINLSVSQTYTTKTEFNALEVGGRNLLLRTGSDFFSGTEPVLAGGVVRSATTSIVTDEAYPGFEVLKTTRGTDTSTTSGRYIYAVRDRTSSGGLEIGENYTLSFWAKGEVDGLIFALSTLAEHTTKVANSDLHITTEWSRFWVTFTTTEGYASFATCFYTTGPANGVYYITKLKLERGNKATDWTPAPEDVDGAIEASPKYKYVTSAYKATSQTYNTWLQWGQEGRSITNFGLVNAAERRKLNIGDLACCEGWNTTDDKPIYIVIEVTEFPSTTSHINGISHGLIDSEIRSTVNAIDSRVSTAETSIQQNSEQITLRATKTEMNQAINNIEVGGRNFLLNTENPTSSKPPKPIGDGITWGGTSNMTLTYAAGVMKLTSSSTSGEHFVRLNTPSHTQHVYESMDVNVHDSLILSGFVRASMSASDATVTVRAQPSTGSNWVNTITLRNLRTGVETTNTANVVILEGSSTEWVRFEVCITIPESMAAVNAYYSFQQYGTFTIGDTVEFKRLKLERGTRATDWSPAPEDMVTTTAFESAKSEIQQTTDGITSTVSKISSVKYYTGNSSTLANIKVWAAEGYTSTWTFTGDLSNLRIGDTVYLKYGDTTRGCNVYIKGTVNSISGQSVNFTAHGYEDVLPVDTIKSTINQSADSVKIEARHVNIEGAAIFSSGRLSETSLNNTYDPKGAAQNAVSGAFDNRVSDSAEFLYRRTADGEDVPSGRATIQTIKGNTLRWNQLAPAYDSNMWFVNNVSKSVNATSRTVTVTSASATSAMKGLNRMTAEGTAAYLTNGHKYLVGATIDNSHSSGDARISARNNSTNATVFQAAVEAGASAKRVLAIGEVTIDNAVLCLRIANGEPSGGYAVFSDMLCFDLTQMFGAGNEPATVAEFEALYPKPYYPYDPGSLLPLRMEGVKTVGFNQWDEQWELGSYNNTNGEKVVDTTRIRCKNLIPVFPDTDYYLNFGNYSLGSQGLYICFYDANGDFLSFLRKWSANLTTPTGAYYMTWRTEPTYGTTYQNDICINISDPARNGTYEPYWSSQCNIPTTELRSAGSVYDELQNGKRITRVGAYTFTGIETPILSDWRHYDGYYATGFALSMIPDRKTFGPSVIPNAFMSGLNATKYGDVYGSNSATVTSGFAMSSGSSDTVYSLFVRVPSSIATSNTELVTWLTGKTLFYELATPVTTQIDPSLNFVYKADPSGTERILVDETKDAPQSSPAPMDITYGVNLYEDTLDDILNVSSRVSATEEAISPLASKTYTGIIGTANDANGASFYFGNVFPVAYDGIWKVHLRINVTEPVLYQQNIDIMISGHKGAYMSFDSVVSRSSSALAVYFINLYRATQTGINAGVGHALGFNLRASTNPTNASYKRTISVDVLDVYNCSVKLLDTAVTYDNLPSYNTTNYGTHSTSYSLDELSVATNGQNASNNGNTYDRTYHNNPIKAATAITAGHIICGTSAGYKNIAAGTTFDISYPLLYSPNAIAVNSTRSDTYSLIPSINFSNNGTIQSGVAYAQLYLKGTIVGNTFTIAASPFMTTVVPTTEDGYFYIPMGIMSSATAGYFESSTAIYAFLDGKFRQVTPTEIVASHRVYYRTGTVNNSLAAPTTWVAEATGNVYNAWTTKIPPLSSGVSSTTKYPYLYTCEQRKRLDGTVECTKVLLDDSNTIIDGGTIITGSIAANKLDVYDATIGKISTSAINLTGYAQTNDIPTKVSDLTNDTGFVTNDDIQIGGRNLVIDSMNFRAGSTASSTLVQTVENGMYKMVVSEGNSANWNGSWWPNKDPNWSNVENNLSNGESFVISFIMRAIGSTKKPTIYLKEGMGYYSLNGALSENWSVVYYTGTWIDNATISPHLGWSGISTSSTYYIKAVKVERGNKPTDWTPAPEDIDADISSKADPSDIPTKVSDLTNDSGFQNSSEVETAITSKGYQTSSQVETAITSKGYATQNSLNSEINQRKAHYGTCSTAAGTQAKAVTCSNFELVAGNELTVKFSTANTYASGAVQLNVNSKGAKNVWVSNAATSSSNQLLWGANAYITFRYDGTQFIVIGEPRTWYGASTTAESTAAKTDTTAVTGCVICKGAKVELAMTNANTATAPTLNIQSTGAKNIYFGNGTARPTKTDGTSWLATNTCTFTFDGQYWRTAGKTYIDANSIVTGYLSADRIEAGSLSANKISATSGTFNTANIPNLSSDKITVGGSTLTSNLSAKDSAIADAAKHTQVIISATNVNYTANTCTLTARLYIDGVLQTSTSLKWQWYRDGTTQGSQTTGATGSLAVTSSLGLAHRYACKCTF